MNLIEQLEQEEIARLGKVIPPFAPGDTVVVQVKVKEGTRERLQAYEGVVIAKRNRGLNSAFTVRKISHGEGVERVVRNSLWKDRTSERFYDAMEWLYGWNVGNCLAQD